MRFVKHLLALGLAVSTAASAGTVSVPLYSEHGSTLSRRDATVHIDALNQIKESAGYFTDLLVGTPPQKVRFHLDTGSSDTWVNAVNATVCTQDPPKDGPQKKCQTPFDPKTSTTFIKDEDGTFEVAYLDETSATGDWFNDTVQIGGQSVLDQSLGLALESDITEGIMGLGLTALATEGKPTILDNMVKHGAIDAAVFSVHLDDLETKSGAILFGGIDTKKYMGKLATLPLIADPLAEDGTIRKYLVSMRSIRVDGVELDTANVPTLLDTGSTITILPKSLVARISVLLGAQIVTFGRRPSYVVDCALADNKDRRRYFEFDFGNKTIRVPPRDFIIDRIPQASQRMVRERVGSAADSWRKVCLLGLDSVSTALSTPKIILGDNFLRSAYVVFDATNLQLGIAQAKFKPSGSNIVGIAKGARTIPDNEGVAETDPETELDSSGVVLRSNAMAFVTVATCFLAVWL
ncbi:hypothetical protein HIM_11269 [Hirsutella minnesotensis 3608]|uniref:Peptidase A1 domain-containing protein n=1 Tax=Hirsutella minnesotensis 3608 TaxID=1043627 RepID=A0A0F7ZWP8_9HYPO|nr:hypothetical protein HIM_11269 [Hirsutella minnesotensis 3608]